jgi:hypothetical protein
MTQRAGFFLALCLMLTCLAMPLHAATTTCAYNFTAGNGSSYLKYCVTVNGNIPQIETPSGVQLIVQGTGYGGEGYGVCNESPAQNYTDYGNSDTGNWNPSVLLSHTSTSVQIARTTTDGHWTLTQTISITHTPSITVRMALTNNQSVQKVAYLVRYAEEYGQYWLAGPTGAVGWSYQGLLLQNVGTPPFGFWQGYVQTVKDGPNACAFAYNGTDILTNSIYGSIEVAYVGPVPAGGTKTVTLTYRGL